MKKVLLPTALVLASGIAIAAATETQQTTAAEGTATPDPATHQSADHAAYPGEDATFEDFDTDQDDVISREEFEAMQERWQGDREGRTTGGMTMEGPDAEPGTHKEAGHAGYPSEEVTDPAAPVAEETEGTTATDVDAEPRTHKEAGHAGYPSEEVTDPAAPVTEETEE